MEIGKNIYTAEYWEYDVRTGRRWNTDLVAKQHESLYACLANDPTWFIDSNGRDSIFYNNRGGELTDTRIKSKEDSYFYQYNEGTLSMNKMKFTPINSSQSLKGHDKFEAGTNNTLVNNTNEFLSELMIKEDIYDDSQEQLMLKSVASLDVAYGQGLIDWLNDQGIETESREYIPDDWFSRVEKSNGRTTPSLTENWSDALFLLPNGKYGNANEFGNYVIGFAWGFAGYNQYQPAVLAHEYRLAHEGKFDEPHENMLLIISQAHGFKTRTLYEKMHKK